MFYFLNKFTSFQYTFSSCNRLRSIGYGPVMNDNTPPPQPAPILPPQAPLVPPAPQQAQQLPAQPQAPAIGVAPLPSSPLASYPYRSINIEKFKGNDFQQWKFKLSLVLAEEDLLTLVKGERRIAENERDPQVIATFNKQDVRARSIICQALDNSLIPHVAAATSAADMFGRLMEQYERKGRASSMYLRKKLFTARMREGENLSTHLNSISELVQQLEGINKPVTEEDVITIIINSLPPSFENLCTNLEGMEDLSLRTLKSRLLQEEVKRSEKTDEDAHAFNANGKGGKPQKKWCAYCRKTGHTIDKCFKRNKANKSKDSSPNIPPPVLRSSNRFRAPNPWLNRVYYDLRKGERSAEPNILGNASNEKSNSAIFKGPSTVSQAIESSDSDAWTDAMQQEYDSLIKNDTWDLVPLPPNRKPISTRWIFKVKQHADGSIDRFKARFVVRGYSQVEGIDYDETFAPVGRFGSLRVLLAIACQENLEIHMMDVDSAFLNGVITEDIYITQPKGFINANHPDYVCKLKKSLYRLKQALYVWNITAILIFKKMASKIS